MVYLTNNWKYQLPFCQIYVAERVQHLTKPGSQGSKIGRSDGLRPVENCNGPTEYIYKIYTSPTGPAAHIYANNIKVVKQELVYV